MNSVAAHKPFVTFASRRQALQDNQQADLTAIIGDIGAVIPKNPQWQVSGDQQADLDANVMLWRWLQDHAEAIVGDFPHAALEALPHAALSVPVYVRLYKIGGGFQRDTEYVRWARIGA